MGWTFEYHPSEKKNFVEGRLKGWSGENVKVEFLHHTVVGNHLWKVAVHTDLHTGVVEKFIALDLLQKYKGCWGYKDLEASCGLYYYDCPLKFLKMVPVENQVWMDSVLAYHAKKKSVQTKKIEAGKTYKIVGRKLPQITITSIKPLRGYYMGVTYRLMKKMIGEEIV